MFKSLFLKVSTPDPIQLSEEFKKQFGFKLIQNNDDGGLFEFTSIPYPMNYYKPKELLRDFKQQFSKFVSDFKILETNDFICPDPYLKLTIDIFSDPNPIILNPQFYEKVIKKAKEILGKKFKHVFIKEGFIIESRKDQKSNS